MGLTVVDHPLAGDLLAQLRDERTAPPRFRTATRRLGWLLVIEATRDLSTEPVEVTTPMETTEQRRLGEELVAVPVLRAGLGLLESVTDLFPETLVGHLGMERDEITLQPRDYYVKLPPMEGRRAIVLDPMLATGGSGSAAVTQIKGMANAKSISFVCVVAAPEGVRRLQNEHPDVPIVAAALDHGLTDAGFIVPGLGDFGDRLHGTT
jgi:uracil phosphoribosyltransferase